MATRGNPNWQPGTSGNPNGRPPKDKALSESIAKQLAKKGEGGQKNQDAVIQKLIDLARAGNMDAIKIILDRVEGKVADRVEHTGAEGGPLETLARILVYMPDNGRDNSDTNAP